MNTYNVYYAKIYKVIKKEFIPGKNLLDSGINTTGSFERTTIVYKNKNKNKNKEFIDLFSKRKLQLDPFTLDIGDEFINAKSLICFNNIIDNTKTNLSKSKIKKLYIEKKNRQ